VGVATGASAFATCWAKKAAIANAAMRLPGRRDLSAGVVKERAEENLSIRAVHLRQDPRTIRAKCIWMNGVIYVADAGV
jgi:hypothetical protein